MIYFYSSLFYIWNPITVKLIQYYTSPGPLDNVTAGRTGDYCSETYVQGYDNHWFTSQCINEGLKTKDGKLELIITESIIDTRLQY